MSAFLPLRDADTSCGAKAVALGRLTRAGVAVPDGFVLPAGTGAGWERDLPGVLESLGGLHFAVRSSAVGEDGPEASYAGQFHTSLNVPASGVGEQVRRTAGAVAQAHAYAAAVGQPAPRGVAVIIQRMLTPDAAGVAFTHDPVTGQRVVVIEAVRGLGDRLVSGLASPERWRIATGEAPRCSAVREVLSPEQAVAVGQIATRVEETLTGGQDVEWALVDGSPWVLQARPITTTTPHRREPAGVPTYGAQRLASGTPASPGRVRGRLRLISGLDDFSRFAPGEVLVCPHTSPAWTPLLARAAAVITAQGGVLSHAAIVARELRIPAVTDVTSAMDLPDGALVDVDGTRGIINAQGADDARR